MTQKMYCKIQKLKSHLAVTPGPKFLFPGTQRDSWTQDMGK